MLAARYGLSPYIIQTRFFFKGLITVSYSRAGLMNLWHACSKWHAVNLSHGIHCCPNYFRFFRPTNISDCAVPLLPNNTASEGFLHKSGAVRSFDSIFITGAPAWRWLDEYVTVDITCYCLLFKRKVAVVPSYFHTFFLIAFLEEAFIRNIIILLCINYIIIICINNTVINNCGRFQDPILLFRIQSISSKFGHAPSKRFASPVL